MLQWIREQIVLAKFDASSLHKIEIASEEALVNIMQHGYQEVPGSIEIIVDRGEKGVEITIRDQGPPFNPLERDTTFDRTAGIDEREIGGLGLLFMREYMDEIRYKREGDTNVLTLVKFIDFSRSK
jgi:serine/threonine-protein kinase RsbW